MVIKNTEIMKKVFYLSAVALCMAGCSNGLDSAEDLPVAREITLTADMGQFGDESKSSISGKEVLWSDGDAIEVYNATGNHATFTLSSGEGTRNGKFTGTLSGTPVAAYYPAVGCKGYDASSGFTAAIPNTQVYSAGSVGNGAFPMVGTITDNAISFKNAGGLLKLSLKGTGKVKSIVLTDLNNPLAGKFVAKVDGTTAYSDGAEYKVTLSCLPSVALNETTATDFYIALPAGALNAGFCAEVMDWMDHPIEVLYTNKDNTIKRNICKAMPLKSGLTMSLPDGFTEAEYIKNGATGTSGAAAAEYINTGVVVSDNFALNAKLFVEKEGNTTASFYPIGSRQNSKYFYFGDYGYADSEGKGWWFYTGNGAACYYRTKIVAAEQLDEYRMALSGTEGKHLFRNVMYGTEVVSASLPTNKIYLFAVNRANAASGEGTAYYPADKFVSFTTGGGFTSTFPDVQIYDASGIVDNGTIPMTGVVNDNVISFKNACGLIKLSLKGEGKVTSVVISDLYNPIAGDLSFATDGTLNSAVNGLHKVKLMCTSPVSLSAGATSDFYIALPSGALSNGFCAEIMNEKGHPAEVFFTSQSNTIVRSACTPMPEKSGLVMSIPTGYTEYTCLKQNGTVPYINTGITVSDDFAVNATMFISDYSSFNTPIGARQTSKYFYVGRYSDTKGWSFWSGVGNSEPTRLYSGDNYGNGIVEYRNVFSGTSGKHLLRGNLYETEVHSSELPTNKIYLFCSKQKRWSLG